MKAFLLAIQFLTIIPLKIKKISDRALAESAMFFPLVGMLIGLFLTIAYDIFYYLGFKDFIINILVVILLVIITGALHLDGLADTFDAFLSRKDKENKLRIMRDPNIGAMGALSLISVILLKIAFLSSIPAGTKFGALVLMCTISRWVMVALMFKFPYARSEGKAKVFIQHLNLKIFLSAALTTILITALLCQTKGIVIFLTTTAFIYLVARFINKRLGGITGDVIGSCAEISEVTTLFLIYILGGVL